MRPLRVFTGLALSASLFGTAAAQPLRWHAGVGLVHELDERGPPAAQRVDAENGATLLVGATHASGFGLEFGYVDLGRLEGRNLGGYDVDGELWSLGATYAVAFDAFEPYARLGRFSRDEDGVGFSRGGPYAVSFDDEGWMAEVGLRWRATDAFALRLGYTHYDFEPDADGSAQLVAEWHFR